MATCGNCKRTGVPVEHVKECYASGKGFDPAPVVFDDELLPCERKAVETGRVSATVFTQPGITAKQESYLNSLLNERPMFRDVENLWPENVAKMTKAEASIKIEEVKKVAKETAKKETAATPDLEDGVYKYGEKIVMVYHTVHGANVQCGKELIVQDNGDGTFSGVFEFRGKAILRNLTPDMRLSQEEAAAFGMVYGFCIRCARTLTREESKHVGYGATCAGHEGWWYPTKAELRALSALAI